MNPPISRRSLMLAGATALTNFPALSQSSLPILGVTLPLSNATQQEVATDLLKGFKLGAESAGNFAIHALDDASDPKACAANIETLAKNSRVLGVSGIVGTPHAEAALPIAVKHRMPVYGIRSGAAFLRSGQENVFHLRATYEAELERLAGAMQGAMSERVYILYSDDTFGKGASASLRQSLAKLNIQVPMNIAVERSGKNLKEMVKQLTDELATERKPAAVALLVLAQPMVQAARLIRRTNLQPLYAMSFVCNGTVSTVADKALAGLGVMLAFPLPRSAANTITHVYRNDCRRAGDLGLIESVTAFEGYFYARCFGQAVANSPTRQSAREDIAAQFSRGFTLADVSLKPDQGNGCYSYLGLVAKSATTGKLYI